MTLLATIFLAVVVGYLGVGEFEDLFKRKP